jgi:hypothetical protein
LHCALLLLQVDQLDASTRTGGGFNQPQYLHLKESISSIIQHLNNLQVGTCHVPHYYLGVQALNCKSYVVT